MPGKRAKKLKDATKEQASGTIENARGAVGSFAIDKVLPSGIAQLLQEIFTLLAKAAGRDSQKAGMFSSITIMIFGVVTSVAYVGIVIFVIGAILFVYNAYRLIPAVNRAHKWAGKRVGLYKDRDIPLWKRD